MLGISEELELHVNYIELRCYGPQFNRVMITLHNKYNRIVVNYSISL